MNSPSEPISKHTKVCAAVFVAVMLFGSYQVISAAMNPAGLDFPKDMKSFREGAMTQTLEKQIDLKLPFRSTAIAFANTIRYQLFAGGGDQVRTGKNDWLFIAEELKFEGQKANHASAQTVAMPSITVTPEAALKARVMLMADLAKHLQAQGVKLVVVLVPDKARLYSQYLNHGDYPPYNKARYQAALDGLKSQNVTAVNLLSVFEPAAKQSEIYYRTDTHWNQLGALLAAKEISSVIKTLNLDLKTINFKTTAKGAAQERSGDLIRLMGLEFVPNFLRPKLDSETLEETIEVATSSTEKPSAGLFDDASVAVVLAGTSYSLRANFHGRLQEHLQTKVLNTAKDGGGFLQAITAYLKDDAFRSSKPQVLLWEVPERMLQSPLADEKGWLDRTLSSN
jgi:alginate O-acetyltransferase complex protein AlgJ